MNIIGFIIGIISIFWLGIALIPLLGWINWFNIPLAAIGLIVSIIGVMRWRSIFGIAGIVLNSIAILVGLLRLYLGGGIL